MSPVAVLSGIHGNLPTLKATVADATAQGCAGFANLDGVEALLILHGHSHLQREHVLPDARRVANPGSVGLPVYDDSSPYFHRMDSGTFDACCLREGLVK